MTAHARALLVLPLLGVLACSGGGGVRIGAKAFVEQEILAEVLAGVLEAQGITTRPTYRCTDTFDCQRALTGGHVDVMVEYSGTAYNLLGEVPPEDGEIERLDALYEPLGVRWLSPLGFDNGYVWLVPGRRAQADGLEAMSDLSRISPLRVAVPPEFMQRPRDGLAATAARYGMTLASDPIVTSEPEERLRAVVTGRADAAVVYGTDPSATDLGLTPLADDLDFLPRYTATVVARSDTLQRVPELADALARLQDSIDALQMQAMNQAVSGDGGSPAAVARQFLQTLGVVEPAGAKTAGRTRLRVATDDPAVRDVYGPRVLMAARTVFPDRTTQLESVSGGAADAVANGRARYGVVGVDAFFRRTRGGALVRRDDLEAVAALGQKVLHFVARGDGDPWAGRIGVVQARGQASAEAAVLADRGLSPVVFRDRAAALAAVGDSIDALLIASPLQDPEIGALLEAGAHLVDVVPDAARTVAERRTAVPFARPARIAERTYVGQDTVVDTLAVQIVLAAPSASALPGHNAAGPAGAIPGGGPPSLAQVEALRAALGSTEAPDPSVPSAFTLGARAVDHTETSALDTVLNVLVLVFCGWLGFIVMRRS